MAATAKATSTTQPDVPSAWGRVSLSYFSLITGWAAGYGSFCVRQVCTDGGIQDLGIMTLATLALSAIGWVFIVLPIVTLVPSRSRIYSTGRATVAGLAGTHSVFFLAVGYWYPEFYTVPAYLLYLCLTGVTGGLVFSLGMKTQFVDTGAGKTLLWLGSVGIVIVFLTVASFWKATLLG